MGKILLLIVAGVVLLGLGAGIGYFAGGTTTSDSSPTPSMQAGTQDLEPAKPNNLFSSQTANLRGEILQRNGKELTVRNVTNQVEGKINVSDRVVITKVNSGSNNRVTSSTPSSDLALIELNKEALIGLEMVNGKYEVVNIQFTPPPPSLPPLPSLRPATP